MPRQSRIISSINVLIDSGMLWQQKRKTIQKTEMPLAKNLANYIKSIPYGKTSSTDPKEPLHTNNLMLFI
jgi:hypothetical protein